MTRQFRRLCLTRSENSSNYAMVLWQGQQKLRTSTRSARTLNFIFALSLILASSSHKGVSVSPDGTDASVDASTADVAVRVGVTTGQSRKGGGVALERVVSL